MAGSASIISGTEVSKEMREKMTQEVIELKKTFKSFMPRLVIVQVGGREDSNVYIRMKIKAASEIGIEAEHLKLPRSVTQHELLTKIMKLNQDPFVHGIIVQMPLDSDNAIDSHLVTDAVAPSKDVDGFNIKLIQLNSALFNRLV